MFETLPELAKKAFRFAKSPKFMSILKLGIAVIGVLQAVDELRSSDEERKSD